MTDLVSGDVVHVADWVFTVLAFAGVLTCLYTALDAWADLRARNRAKLNGSLMIVGKVARRQAFASMFLHLGFLALGLLASFSPPPASRREYAFASAVVFILVQVAVVGAQARSQLDRSNLRKEESPK